jgi:hypothetical protein
MFLVYGVCGLFVLETVYRRSFHKFWVIRGIFYSIAILVFEFISGFALVWITSYKIWYYNDILNIMHMTSLYTLPLWFLAGLLIETIYRELMDTDVRKMIQTEIDEAVLSMEKTSVNK